jgi:hypothetical protein
MEVHKRDLIEKLLQRELLKQQEFQTDNMKVLANTTHMNEFLGEVQKDYMKHYQFMMQQKREKEAQLQQLLDYLKKSAKQAEITQTLLLQTKHEKHRLLREIDEVRREIDNMIIENNNLIGV